jgi:hypothetical protein
MNSIALAPIASGIAGVAYNYAGLPVVAAITTGTTLAIIAAKIIIVAAGVFGAFLAYVTFCGAIVGSAFTIFLPITVAHGGRSLNQLDQLDRIAMAVGAFALLCLSPWITFPGSRAVFQLLCSYSFLLTTKAGLSDRNTAEKFWDQTHIKFYSAAAILTAIRWNGSVGASLPLAAAVILSTVPITTDLFHRACQSVTPTLAVPAFSLKMRLSDNPIINCSMPLAAGIATGSFIPLMLSIAYVFNKTQQTTDSVVLPGIHLNKLKDSWELKITAEAQLNKPATLNALKSFLARTPEVSRLKVYDTAIPLARIHQLPDARLLPKDWIAPAIQGDVHSLPIGNGIYILERAPQARIAVLDSSTPNNNLSPAILEQIISGYCNVPAAEIKGSSHPRSAKDWIPLLNAFFSRKDPNTKLLMNNSACSSRKICDLTSKLQDILNSNTALHAVRFYVYQNENNENVFRISGLSDGIRYLNQENHKTLFRAIHSFHNIVSHFQIDSNPPIPVANIQSDPSTGLNKLLYDQKLTRRIGTHDVPLSLINSLPPTTSLSLFTIGIDLGNGYRITYQDPRIVLDGTGADSLEKLRSLQALVRKHPYVTVKLAEGKFISSKAFLDLFEEWLLDIRINTSSAGDPTVFWKQDSTGLIEDSSWICEFISMPPLSYLVDVPRIIPTYHIAGLSSSRSAWKHYAAHPLPESSALAQPSSPMLEPTAATLSQTPPVLPQGWYHVASQLIIDPLALDQKDFIDRLKEVLNAIPSITSIQITGMRPIAAAVIRNWPADWNFDLPRLLQPPVGYPIAYGAQLLWEGQGDTIDENGWTIELTDREFNNAATYLILRDILRKFPLISKIRVGKDELPASVWRPWLEYYVERVRDDGQPWWKDFFAPGEVFDDSGEYLAYSTQGGSVFVQPSNFNKVHFPGFPAMTYTQLRTLELDFAKRKTMGQETFNPEDLLRTTMKVNGREKQDKQRIVNPLLLLKSASVRYLWNLLEMQAHLVATRTGGDATELHNEILQNIDAVQLYDALPVLNAYATDPDNFDINSENIDLLRQYAQFFDIDSLRDSCNKYDPVGKWSSSSDVDNHHGKKIVQAYLADPNHFEINEENVRTLKTYAYEKNDNALKARCNNFDVIAVYRANPVHCIINLDNYAVLKNYAVTEKIPALEARCTAIDTIISGYLANPNQFEINAANVDLLTEYAYKHNVQTLKQRCLTYNIIHNYNADPEHVKINEINVGVLKAYAQDLGLTDLEARCDEFLSTPKDFVITTQNVANLRAYAQKRGLREMETECDAFEILNAYRAYPDPENFEINEHNVATLKAYGQKYSLASLVSRCNAFSIVTAYLADPQMEIDKYNFIVLKAFARHSKNKALFARCKDFDIIIRPYLDDPEGFEINEQNVKVLKTYAQKHGNAALEARCDVVLHQT